MRIISLVSLCAAITALSACSRGDVYSKAVSGAKHINNTEKFSSRTYGVAASPRVSTAKRVRKGGGRRQIGKPYKIRGKWYTPKEEIGYNRVGNASWYGPNFHGRLTANGEIYDQYALSAAHPTFPLPSYARVTNLANGKSVVVRVNDRGPYHAGRVIDLSARAAGLLDYKSKGVAKVRVRYIKQAPLHGKDEKFLVATYREPGGATPSQIAATGVAAPSIPIEGPFDPETTGSVPKKKSDTKDPFLKELAAINGDQDTGSTLSYRLKKKSN